MRGLVGPFCQIWPAVKANAYGHGACPVVRALVGEGADGFCVATPEEAEEIASCAQGRPVLLLGAFLEEDAEAAIASGAQSAVADVLQAKELSRAAVRLHKTVCVHLKIDTGMGRIGVRPESAAEAALAIDRMSGLRLAGLMTHFASADMADLSRAREQLRIFTDSSESIYRALGRKLILHCANSGAVLSLPHSNLSCVRPGIMLYGSFPSPECVRSADLQPVMTLRSRVVFLKDVSQGESVSYGHTWTAARPSRIATVSLGYGDGLPRRLSNRGVALIREQRAPIAGRVCMDQTMLDVTDIGGVELGDEVVFWGVQGGSELRLEEVAKQIEGSPYELMCSVASRVERVYTQ